MQRSNNPANQSAGNVFARIGDVAGENWNPAQTRTSIWFEWILGEFSRLFPFRPLIPPFHIYHSYSRTHYTNAKHISSFYLSSTHSLSLDSHYSVSSPPPRRRVAPSPNDSNRVFRRFRRFDMKGGRSKTESKKADAKYVFSDHFPSRSVISSLWVYFPWLINYLLRIGFRWRKEPQAEKNRRWRRESRLRIRTSLRGLPVPSLSSCMYFTIFFLSL